MKRIVDNYLPLMTVDNISAIPKGTSAAPKELIFHILKNNSGSVDVLDIGFGAGELASLIKKNPETSHWVIDGIDGWEPNCYNKNLIENKFYRNIWHGFAQDLPSEIISKYKIICLLDVIEHLNVETAKWLLRTLLNSMGEDSYLFISTPLWFYPQDHLQDGDLEEHLIGVPASSMMALLPIMYSISHPLVGGFVLGKRSIKYIEFFQPTMDKDFSYEMGFNILKSIGVNGAPGIVYKTGF